ncbi:MAG: PilZ domain-containing protein [Candidatus Eremiobacteraeota bacterium]|nr:PilZ domain-containing protein [Candidatus Eremiobacteraeota bacterium]
MWQSVKESIRQLYTAMNRPIVFPAEKRRLARVALTLTVMALRSVRNESLTLTTENINVYGIKFFSPVALAPGETLDMTILLQTSHRNITTKGEVRWCQEAVINGKRLFEGGIEFQQLNKYDNVLLKGFIERYKTGCN